MLSEHEQDARVEAREVEVDGRREDDRRALAWICETCHAAGDDEQCSDCCFNDARED